MKKIIIISAIVLTSGLTALSITRSESKGTAIKENTEKANLANKNVVAPNAERLAIAD